MSGEVYIIPETGRFFQLRGVHDDYAVIGGLCAYYRDAITNIMDAQVSWDFVKAAELVVSLDKIPGVIHDGIDWRHEAARL